MALGVQGSFDYISACAKRASTCSAQDDRVKECEAGMGWWSRISWMGLVMMGVEYWGW